MQIIYILQRQENKKQRKKAPDVSHIINRAFSIYWA